MAMAYRSSIAANGTSTTVTTLTPTLPTGWAAGDLVAFCISIGANFTSPTNPAGWTTRYDTNGDSTGRTILAYRTMQTGDAAPTFSWTGTGKWAYTGICAQPAAGSQAVLLAPGAPTVSATSTSHTPPSYAAGASTGMSILMSGYRGSINQATAITSTAPTNWTEPASDADTSTAINTTTATRQVASWHAYRTGQTGTVTPAAYTTSVTALSNKYHLFVVETAPAEFMPPSPDVYQSAAVYRAHYW